MSTRAARRTFSIKEAAALTGLPASTLRYYESIGVIAPVSRGARDDADDVASKLLASLKAQGSELPPTLCGGRMAVDQVQRLIRIDGHPIAITEMEYRVLELLAFARNNVVTRTMLLKHLYRRADDQP